MKQEPRQTSHSKPTKGKLFTGVVVSTTMQHTVIVAIERIVRHPIYKKAIRRSRRFAAHNETLELVRGDRVKIMETRPVSKTKHFVVAEKL